MKVVVIMGSFSDRKTVQESCNILDYFEIPYEKQVVFAHRTSKMMVQPTSEVRERGTDIVIAGAGGMTHLPGMAASLTTLPVIGVPIETKGLEGIDSLLSIVRMLGDIPVTVTAIGAAGAKNVGILATRILSIQNPSLAGKLNQYGSSLVQKVEDMQNELQ